MCLIECLSLDFFCNLYSCDCTKLEIHNLHAHFLFSPDSVVPPCLAPRREATPARSTVTHFSEGVLKALRYRPMTRRWVQFYFIYLSVFVGLMYVFVLFAESSGVGHDPQQSANGLSG